MCAESGWKRERYMVEDGHNEDHGCRKINELMKARDESIHRERS